MKTETDHSEERKREEIEFHNRLRGEGLKTDPERYKHYTSNYKFYAIDRANREFCEDWLRQRCAGKKTLDYCCGEGDYSMMAARFGAYTVGIDISDVAIRLCKERASREGLASKSSFFVMDSESTGFEDNSFDLIICAGVLHHLDVERAYSELARLLKPDGEIICMEALGHNPLIQWYRRRTPHLRTRYEMEHILRTQEIDLAKNYFGRVEIKYFHLATLAGIPFSNLSGFSALLRFLETIDAALLRTPGIQKLAWMVAFTLARPIKTEMTKLQK